MKVTERLLEATNEIWDAYNEHPFVKGIQEGTLERDKFRFYIIQDYLYLEEYAKVFAIGVAKAKSIEMAQLFAKYIEVMNGELNVHNGYMGVFQVSEEEIANNPNALKDDFYGTWIQGYASEEYAKGNVVLLDTLNRLTQTYSEEQIQHLIDIFVACSRYELAFWEMSWNKKM